jgi:hypothetical protein
MKRYLSCNLLAGLFIALTVFAFRVGDNLAGLIYAIAGAALLWHSYGE